MGADKIPYRNPEGYADPTAHDALASIVQAEEAADQRCMLLIRVLKARSNWQALNLPSGLSCATRLQAGCTGDAGKEEPAPDTSE